MNYYEVLEISEKANNREIKKAYKQLVKKYHPDVFKGDKSIAEEKIKQINEAYDTLSNEQLKKEYDESLSYPHSSNSDLNTNSTNTANTSYNSHKDDNNYNPPKYEDLYKYDYYKKYTTNYYGVSKPKPEQYNPNTNINSNPLYKYKSKFILIGGFAIISVLILLILLLSSFKKMLSNPIPESLVSGNYSNSTNNNLPYIRRGMTYSEVKELLGSPDFTEQRSNGVYAYWGISYIVFDKNNLVIDWKNHGAFNTDLNVNENQKDYETLYNSIENLYFENPFLKEYNNNVTNTY